MFNSIRTSLFAAFVGLISIFLVSVLVINVFFLDDIFIAGTMQTMEKTSAELAEALEYEGFSSETLAESSFGSGLFIAVFSEAGVVEFNSGLPRTKMEEPPEKESSERDYYEKDSSEQELRAPKDRNPVRSEINGEASALLKKFLAEPTQEKLFYTEKAGGARRSVILLKRLDNGKILLMMKPLMPLQESSHLATVFILVSGAVVLLIGSIGVFLLSGRLTAPILNMDRVARKMAALDFSEAVIVSGRDELGALGSSIQTMSENLNQTLNELQEANGKLQLEIERERELDRQRRRFISSVSHELRTPLSMIQGYADGLRHGVVEEPIGMKEYCDVIVDETKKMSGLIRDMLDLSSYEAGAFAYTMGSFDLAQMVRKSAQRVHALINVKDASVEVEGPDVCMAFGDEGRIGQILSNFITNAINHGAEGEAIHVSYGISEGMTTIKVFNRGPQIPVDDLEHIWDPFYKVGEGALARGAGFGLGLAIAHAIAEAHGGECYAENLEGGVAFSFRWPEASQNETVQ